MEAQHLPDLNLVIVGCRLKWTPELHQRFLDAINQLGGATRATPNRIRRLMGVPGLTVWHIKSHLQKYRQQVELQIALNNNQQQQQEIPQDIPDLNIPYQLPTNAGVCLSKMLFISVHNDRSVQLTRHYRLSALPICSPSTVFYISLSKLSSSHRLFFSPLHSPSLFSSYFVKFFFFFFHKMRMTWTPALQRQFVSVVNQLGGAEKATPIKIRNLMNKPSLSINNITSHLQTYRYQLRAISQNHQLYMEWTAEQHYQFVQAVDSLGGATKAVPSQVCKKMNNPEIQYHHVKAHLQKYRQGKLLRLAAEVEKIHPTQLTQAGEASRTGENQFSCSTSNPHCVDLDLKLGMPGSS